VSDDGGAQPHQSPRHETHERYESEDSEDNTPKERASPDELEVERLRQLQSRILQQQQLNPRLKSPSQTSSPGEMVMRRVSPIREESMSPTLEGAFESPLPTGHTESTESTESTRTVRASVPPTPAGQQSLRTPSYPFPTVNTPRGWSTSFHQPFTTLSPTANAMYMNDVATPRDRIASDTSTPAASAMPFAPERASSQSVPEDPRFPTPSLYDLVLTLSSEPGLKAWWNTVTMILHDWYGAERATLAVPADTSDIENVPWGQKTTFNLAYRGATHVPPHSDTVQDKRGNEQGEHMRQEWRSTEAERAEQQRLLSTGAANKRPTLTSRHSFAGHERQKNETFPVESTPTVSPMRPRGPLRTASHIPLSTARSAHPLRQVSQASFDGSSPSVPSNEHTFSDPEFSSVGEGPSAPLLAVFPVLRALDHEPDALIDNAGIIRVLERGRLVTLTRDYSVSLGGSRKNSSESERDEQTINPGTKPTTTTQELPKPSNMRGRSGMASRAGNTEPYEHVLVRNHYEEYEQFPTSPWAQSPAPSPAIQGDPEENPFFSPGNVDEETFNPSIIPQDYSRFEQVEAIGVDKANTITHLPLIHPALSQPMHPPESKTPSENPSTPNKASDNTPSTPKGEKFQRRTPIAILSILSSTVPYPQNLTNSLKLLGPHLATTFSNAWQYTNAHAQAVGIRHRRYMSGHQMGFAPMSDQESLDDLLHLDLENISNSAAGSVTSPSDYSGRSKNSPGGSIGGTPGWDPSSIGFSSRHSVGSTPGYLVGSDAVESYFDAKKKSTTSAPGQSASGPLEQGLNRKSEKRSSKRVSIGRVPEGLEEGLASSRNDKAGQRQAGLDDMAGQHGTPMKTRLSSSQAAQTGTERRQHSLLHSYGADFSSSFQSLPAATTPGARTPGLVPGQVKLGSAAEAVDMPPPSESLLRTIIDSLPVQIFTALPTAGALTWVNSKFLVYRGQDSRQVLQTPWDAIHPDDREAYLEQWSNSLRTGQQLQKKVRLQRFDGQYRWFYIRVAPLKNKRQQIVHWIGTNMDIHDQQLAEANSARQQETAASEAKYRALANSSPQVVFVVSNTRGLTFCNSQWITYSGQAEIQAHGTGFLEHVHPDDVIKCKLPEMNEDGSIPTNVPTSLPPDSLRPDSRSDDSSDTEKTVMSPGSSSSETMEMPQARLSKLAGTGILKVTRDADGRASYSTEVRLRNREGEYRWHLVRVLLDKALASGDDKDEETWYGTATDINDHKLLEQTLKETMDAKTRFLSNMSHEIRTPLNGISGMVNFLLDSPLNTEQLEHVNIIKASTDSLLNLINDILDLSKVEAGMIKLSMDWLHIPSLLEEVNDLNMGLAIQKGLELNYVVEEGVPSMVKGDKFRIRQVLLNVVGNAIKFTQQGEVFVRCRLCPLDRPSLKDNESMIRFEIIDTGRGFSEDEAKYLFKRFSQIDASSTRQHGGTGLGLAISMQFVELHGGKMDARSAPGKGSTFYFTIKFGIPSEDDHPPPGLMTPGTPAMDPVTPLTQPVAHPLSMQKLASMNAVTTLQKDRPIVESPEPHEAVKSPALSLNSSERSRDSPALSSASSEPSIYTTGRSSIRSERSSASSYIPEIGHNKESQIMLALPRPKSETHNTEKSDQSSDSTGTVRPEPIHRSLSPLGSTIPPPMFSILIVCPLVYSREATMSHIKNTLPENIPHQITTRSSVLEAQKMIGGDDPVLFTHVVLVLHDCAELIVIMDQVFTSLAHSSTSIVIISDPSQKKEIMNYAPYYDYDKLITDRRLRFIYRPLKPSKFAVIFDPQKEREMSTDRNQDNAQQVAVSQKLVFEEMKRRIGHKGYRVLLVEDNHINQTVILKFLAKISIDTETALDGAQCTDRVFSKPPGYYSIILCDLHMPNKDGYQACKEIRRWEKKNGHRRHPIIALSANVLGDVYAKCVEAGFNSYVTKPVEFKELSLVMTKFLDPDDPSKPPEFMRPRKA
jgi:PAS domain S-box-containing protein